MSSITKIEAKKPLVTERKKVAAYARVSLDSDRLEHSLSAQISYYSSLIQQNPEWVYAGVYSDNGISGTQTAKRHGFQEMMADAEAGKIDIILTKSISRFARNTVDLLESVRKLKLLGVEVRFEKEYIRTGGNPLFSRAIRLFLCRFVAYLSLKSTKGYSMIIENMK